MRRWHPPRFRTTCLIVAALHGLVGGGILMQGVPAAMAPFGVPAQTLQSAHYVDAIQWVYLHTVVLGATIGVVGWFARAPDLKLWFARVMLGAHAVYATLDFAHSSTALGNGLYQGDGSVIPALMATAMGLLFVAPSVRREDSTPTPAAAQ